MKVILKSSQCLSACVFCCAHHGRMPVFIIQQCNSRRRLPKRSGRTDFSVLPIDYSAINPKDLGYTNNAEWDADKSAVPKAFADAFPVLLKEANITNKKISVVSGGDKITQGVIAQ